MHLFVWKDGCFVCFFRWACLISFKLVLGHVPTFELCFRSCCCRDMSCMLCLQGKQQNLPDTMVQPDSQIVLAGGKSEEAIIESMPEESDDMEVTCKKCGRSVSILQTLARSDTSRWCLACNALQTLLRRHMSWPPEQFSKMSEDDQKNFFLMANICRRTVSSSSTPECVTC